MKRRFFSRKDGTTFKEDVHDLSDNLKEFFHGLPENIKLILPDAEDFVAAVQAVSDAIKDGEVADIAVRKALEFIPGDLDTEIYEKAKHLLEQLAIRLQIILENAKTWDWRNAKKETATILTMATTSATTKDASYAVETSVYYTKKDS